MTNLPLPLLIQNHCKKNGITWLHEGEDAYEFTAPDGMVFPNEGRRRILEISMMTARQCVDALYLSEGCK